MLDSNLKHLHVLPETKKFLAMKDIDVGDMTPDAVAPLLRQPVKAATLSPQEAVTLLRNITFTQQRLLENEQAELLQFLDDNVSEFTADQVCEVLSSFARCPDVLASNAAKAATCVPALADTLTSRLQDLSDLRMGQLLWDCAAINVLPSISFLHAYCNQLNLRGARMNARSLAASASALLQLPAEHPDVPFAIMQLEKLLPAKVPYVHETDLLQLLASYCLSGRRMPAAISRAVMDTSLELLPFFAVPELLMLLDGLVQQRARVEQGWLQTVSEALGGMEAVCGAEEQQLAETLVAKLAEQGC